MYQLENVFGVNKDPVLSYVERPDVDGMFTNALRTDKQIIVYGASKQGKTSLVEKHLPYRENIVISLTPKFQLIDIYKSILNGLKIKIVGLTTTSSQSTTEVGFGTKVKALIPAFLSSTISGNASSSESDVTTTQIEEIELNLALPNDVASVFKKSDKGKFIILENFHYLDEDIQKQFAFDLRSFQELGIRFVILGVWREKNRLIQFNGDLLDRIFEIPVEPWDVNDFIRVVNKGSELLCIDFSDELINDIITNSFDSIGVVQELLKSVCQMAGVHKTQSVSKTIDDLTFLKAAKKEKVAAYAARHLRALEAIAEGRKSKNNPKTNDISDMPLYLPYYTVRCIINCPFDDVIAGIKRNNLEKKIKEIHHRPADVRSGDMSNLLYTFAKLQSEKSISPPIFDYDKTTQTIRVIDSTFYFFLRNVNPQEIMEQIIDPTQR